MATILRTFLLTEKGNIPNINPKNGQIIAAYDSDEVWYDAPADGTRDGDPVRRKVSGIKVVTTLPEDENPPKTPMEDIVYVYIGDHGTLPDTEQNLYDMRVWVNGEWYVVGTNKDDSCVKSTVVVNDKFYLVGTDQATESIGPLVKNTDIFIQNGVINGKFKGNVDGKAETAGTADKANTDSREQPITNYLYDISTTPATPTSIGSTLTFTVGNGTTKTINVQDTRYEVFTQHTNIPGLVNGTDTTVNSDTTGLLLSGSGWIDMNNIDFPTVDSAEKDASGQVITSTYVKSAHFDNNNRELTLTYGDSTEGIPIPIPDTTYGEVTTSAAGLAPALPTNDATLKYLRGDKQWATLPTFAGSTAGMVPSAVSTDAGKFLKGNGTWGSTFGLGTDGLVPGPATADARYSLKANGTWTADIDTKNTAGATQDTSKLFLVGAKAQSSEPQTYSNSLVFIDGNKLYQSNGATPTPTPVQVVDVSSVQTISNKSFMIDGVAQQLGDASTKTTNVAFDPTDSDYDANKLPTNGAVVDYVDTIASNIQTSIDSKPDSSIIAPAYATTGVSYAVCDLCIYADENGIYLYRCKSNISAPAGDFDATKWDRITLVEAMQGVILTDTLATGNTSLTLSSPYITTGAVIDVHTSIYGLQPSNVVVSAGQVDLTFAAQATDVVVKVKLV